ncbi:SDR family NAD(P)-dependent oxidoreductase, partial [Streptomyces sp. UH6]|uniref:SDR family NAD(P)-dependent oxidoreductase n=1 Tax=Streptomyces sp. UH6 TaxID=2748379 RepID=UPI0015D4C901
VPRLAPAADPHVLVATPTDDDRHWDALLAEQPATSTVVVLLGEDTPHGHDAEGGPPTERALRHTRLLRSLALAARRRTESDDGTRVRLWLVTPPTGALPGPERPLHPSTACAWGVARTLGNEYPDLDVRRISLDLTGTQADADRLAAELTDPGPEDEILLTRAGRFVPRVREAALTAREPAPADASATSYALRLSAPGRNYRLDWAAAPAPAPGPDELLISVSAAALNYKDVLQALGAIPVEERQEEAGGNGFTTGMECAGTVLAVGSRVTGFTPGDRVMAFGRGTLRSHVTVPAAMAARLPHGMDACRAATLPVVFLTVHHALHDLARPVAGETVLVHGAAGGVGLAALQYARQAGLRVVATAGTATKRDLLRTLGVRHVLDSRSPGFAERVKEMTDGVGVDIVLNSLSGEAMTRGLEVLRPGGRFIELGKRDIYADGRLPLGPFLNAITFSAANLDTLVNTRPETVATAFAEVAERVGQGVHQPVPHHVYPAHRVTEAFEALQHSRHIGKVVISLEEPPPVREEPRPFTPDANGTYLITGGLTGFGAATARGLADRGARHLVLVGRRGARTPDAPALLEDLRRRGVSVSVHAADVADPVAMAEVLRKVDAAQPPLRGVLHSATVIDDAPLGRLTPDQAQRVLLPKADGAEVLHRLTRDRDLELFVVYSSVSALFGNQNQGGYNAANLFLEALTRSRRAAGLPGLAVAWGALGEHGFVARHGIGDVMRRMGFGMLSSEEALTALETLLGRDDDVAVVTRTDWSLARGNFTAVRAPRFRDVGAVGGDDDERGDGAALRQTLAALSPEEALARTTEVVTDILCRILQTTVDRVPADRRLDQLGLDSLMGVELLTAANQRLGCALSAVEVLDSTTVADVARRYLRRLLQSTG